MTQSPKRLRKVDGPFC